MCLLKYVPYSEDRHSKQIYEILSSDETQQMLYDTLVVRSYSRFSDWMTQNFKGYWHDYFVVETKSRTILGFVYSYEFNFRNDTCKICICINMRYREYGIGAIAGSWFIEYLFNHYPLRKIYAEVFDFNASSLNMAKEFGFQEEGCLRDVCWHQGDWHDQYILSMERTSFAKLNTFGVFK